MTIDLGTVAVDAIIAHEIPRRLAREEMSELDLSQAVPPVPPATLAFFTRRVRGTLAKRGQPVEADPRLESRPVPDLVTAFLDGTEPDLVLASHGAARHLYQSQTGNMSQGILLACAARLGDRPAMALMKLEREEGVLLEHKLVEGQPTLMVTVLDDLTLTDHTRVFKAGLFWLGDAGLEGLVSDEQQGEPVAIADYFLTTFLGCRLTRLPKVLTKAFHGAVVSFATSVVTDPYDKLDLLNALHAEITSNRTRIDPQQFAVDHLPAAYRDPFVQALRSADIPLQGFRKDATSLGRRAGQSRLTTEQGIVIAGPSATVEELVSTQGSGDDRVIIIRDNLSKVS